MSHTVPHIDVTTWTSCGAAAGEASPFWSTRRGDRSSPGSGPGPRFPRGQPPQSWPPTTCLRGGLWPPVCFPATPFTHHPRHSSALAAILYNTSLNSIPFCFLLVLASLDGDSWSMSRTSRIPGGYLRRAQHVVSTNTPARSQNSQLCDTLVSIVGHKTWLISVSQMLISDYCRLAQKSHFIRINGRHLALH